MKGNVIGFDPDSNAGAISGDDGRRYDFSAEDWQGEGRPQHGDVVDFIPEGQRAAQVYLIEPEYVRPGFLQFYFSPSGRISRSQYWLGYVVPVVAISIVLSAISGIARATGNYGTAGLFEFIHLIFGLLAFWPGFAVLIKRMHDRDKSGWLVLLPVAASLLVVVVALPGAAIGSTAAGILAGIMAVALVGMAIWFFTEFGCMRGTIGPNRYGPDPVVAR